MAETEEQENFELDKSFQEFNSDGGLSSRPIRRGKTPLRNNVCANANQ